MHMSYKKAILQIPSKAIHSWNLKWLSLNSSPGGVGGLSIRASSTFQSLLHTPLSPLTSQCPRLLPLSLLVVWLGVSTFPHLQSLSFSLLSPLSIVRSSLEDPSGCVFRVPVYKVARPGPPAEGVRASPSPSPRGAPALPHACMFYVLLSGYLVPYLL